MPAFLVPFDEGQCLIPLEKAVVLIGRQSDCDISLGHSRKVSRKHCCVAQVNNTVVGDRHNYWLLLSHCTLYIVHCKYSTLYTMYNAHCTYKYVQQDDII